MLGEKTMDDTFPFYGISAGGEWYIEWAYVFLNGKSWLIRTPTFPIISVTPNEGFPVSHYTT
jgi:hypothetical protein